jgi:hypothetical protein
VADADLDLIAQEDPAAAELVARQDAAARELERGRDRQVQQLGDLARVEDVVARKGLPERRRWGWCRSHRSRR